MVIAIYNKHARGGRVGALKAKLKQALGDQLPDHVWVETESAEHGKAQAAKAGPRDIVVAMGGDGSVHTVVEGLERSGFRATLGIIPAGTGNDFAFAVDAPLDIGQAVAALASGQSRVVDVGMATLDGAAPIPFANAIGVGFDAAASVHSRKRKFLPGVARYLVSALETLMSWESPQARITGSGVEWEDRMMFATIGNAARSGGGFLITPDATVDDGCLDACLVSHIGRAKAIRLIPKVMAGDHRETPEASLVRGTEFILDVARPVPVHADGEIVSIGTKRIEARIRPACMKVVAPA